MNFDGTFKVGDDKLREIKRESNKIVELITKESEKNKIDSDVFIGGSLAKGTMSSGDFYDVDIFVRFDWKYGDISKYLEKMLKKICKSERYKMKMIRGSRNYFRLWKKEEVVFEIIPVARIKNPKYAVNITDLSYFHVNYIKKRINKKLSGEVVLAKAFCKANGVYGAESYINGFSGYGLECLIIYYKSFEKMLRELAKVKERIVIDMEKKFKKKEDALFDLNESKLRSPIILIDPTYKERNVLAALSNETFEKFQEIAKKFLKKPSEKYFEKKEVDENSLIKKAKKTNGEYIHIFLETDRQEGDIAGTKLKKFSRYLENEIKEYFNMIYSEFVYNLKNGADFYLILKSKKEIVKIGPPLKMEEAMKAFKKKNKNCFEKNGCLHSRIKVDFSGKEFIRRFKKKYNNKIKEMDVTDIGVI